MSEQVVAPAEAVDPFEGKEVSFEEFSNYRKTGEVPERIKAEAPKQQESEPSNAEGENVEDQDPSIEQDAEVRDEKGRFARPPESKFTPDQQKYVDKIVQKRLAKQAAQLRAEHEAAFKASSGKTSETQVTATAQKPAYKADDFLSANPPEEPQFPDPDTFSGTWEELKLAQKEAIKQRDNWRDAKRDAEQFKIQAEKDRNERQKVITERVKKFSKTNPDYEDELAQLKDEIDSGSLPMGRELIDFVSYNLDAPVEVIYHLCKNRDVLDKILATDPNKAAGELYRLDGRLQAQAAAPAPDKKPAEPKPKPPAPVGGRASATAFDVSDTSLSPDEWAKLRNEQLAKRRGR
jgi:hypothetical protein